MIYLIIVLMAIFAIWGHYAVTAKNRQTLIDNMKRYEKEKAKQQKSKV